MASKAAELLLRIKETGSEALDKVSASFDLIKQAATAAFAIVSAVIIKSIDEYKDQELAVNKLSQAMVNQGVYSTQLKNAYLEQANALAQLSTYGDEQIVNAQAVLQGYLGQTKVSRELTQATLDLAAAKGIDLTTAADMVGKAIGTSTNALARQGIEVTTNASQTQKLSEVIDQLNGKFAGQAQAATQGLGSINLLKKSVGEIAEAIGERLAPIVTNFALQLNKWASDQSNINAVVNTFIGTLKVLAQAGTIIYGVFDTVSKLIATELAMAFETVSLILDGKFKQAFEVQKTRMTSHIENTLGAYQSMTDRLKTIDDMFLVNKQETLAKEEQLIADSNARKSQAQSDFRAQESVKKMEQDLANQELEMQLLAASEERRAMVELDSKIKAQQQILAATTNAQQKLAAQQEIFRLNEQKKELMMDEARIANQKSTFATIATLSRSNNSTLAAIGKAAGITQIAIDTPVAISKALAAFPPPFNFAAAGLVGAAMAAQAAQIAGVPLAEGGIVLPRPGGTQAVIGEAGQAEAVIPLDRANEFGLGGGGGQVNITFTGPVLGDQVQAREFAMVIDRELLKMRRNNESVAFDSGVI